jgi:hypothetical protein
MTSSAARRRTTILAATATVAMVALHTPAAQAEPVGRGSTAMAATAAAGQTTTDHLLDEPAHGRAALAALGDDLSVAAARNGSSAQQLRDLLLEDRTAWLSSRGELFYKEPVSSEPPAGSAEVQRAAFPYAETFSLHSNPGSQRTIFLDFDGATVKDTWWNDSYPATGTTHPAWTLDGDAATFSTAERDAVQLVWQIVAEDFAPFDVDVTTEDPGDAALARTSSGDLAFGTRALITPSSSAQGAICPRGCGGVAFVGTFNEIGSAAAQPAWVFPHMLGDDPKAIAEAATHEVGHNLGLRHDGHGADDYYLGHGAWAPIMGVGYYQPVTQWSIGDYAQATNTENDLAVIQDHGLARVVDDHAATAATATGLGAGTAVRRSGVVTTRSDVDVFAAELTCAGTLNATAEPDPLAPEPRRPAAAAGRHRRAGGLRRSHVCVRERRDREWDVRTDQPVGASGVLLSRGRRRGRRESWHHRLLRLREPRRVHPRGRRLPRGERRDAAVLAHRPRAVGRRAAGIGELAGTRERRGGGGVPVPGAHLPRLRYRPADLGAGERGHVDQGLQGADRRHGVLLRRAGDRSGRRG